MLSDINPFARHFTWSTVSAHLVLLFLLLLAVIYTTCYLAHPALPGNPSFPLGWWGWADQGEYIRSARAFAAHDYAPRSHIYPLLYPYLGSFFVSNLPNHPFFPVNLIAFLITAGGFVYVAGYFVGIIPAGLLFILTVIIDWTIFKQYIAPWTTTPVAAVFSLLLLLLFYVSRALPSRRTLDLTAVGFGLLGGFLVPLRPVDAVVFVPLYLAFVYRAATIAVLTEQRSSGAKIAAACTRVCCLVGLGFLPGVCLFFAFNLHVSGTLVGNYLLYNSTIHGFTFQRLPEKLVSFLLDPGAIYLEPHAALFEHYPWLLLSLIGLGLVLFRGPLVLQAVAACVVMSVVLYFPYNDLLPNGIWRYSNIHYFVWMMPWLGFFALWPLVVTWQTILMAQSPRMAAVRIVGVLLLAAGAVMVALLRFQISGAPARVTIVSPHEFDIDTKIEGVTSAMVDIVDLSGTTANFHDTYFGAHRVSIGSSAFRPMADFRVLPAPWGVRLIFMRQLPGGIAHVVLDPGVDLKPGLSTGKASRFSFAFGEPCWLFHCALKNPF